MPSSSSSSSSDSSDDDRPYQRGPRRVIMKRRQSSLDSGSSDDYERRLLELDRLQAEKEWEEGLEQLYTIMSLVLLPIAGKYFGRRWAHALYARYNLVGFGLRFFVGSGISSFFLPSS